MKKIIDKIISLKNSWLRIWRVFVYKNRDRKPWSYGYREYKWNEINNVLNENKIIGFFGNEEKLSEKFGVGLDERIVEYPWIFSQIPQKPTKILDVGSTFDRLQIIDHPLLKNKELTILNIEPGANCFHNKGISYVLSDVRKTPFRDNEFDLITCISTLEHVGMDNTILYSKKDRYRENNPADYLPAIDELYRIVRPGGVILITLPFGRYENHRFLQQFDHDMIKSIEVRHKNTSTTYYLYDKNGWQKTDWEKAKDSHYFNIHADAKIPSDMQAAAKSIVCIKIKK